MQTNGNVIRNQGILWPTPAWETLKEWTGAPRMREAFFNVALALTAFGSAGFVLLSLHRIVTNWTMTGF